jgi:hypothetical protein
VTCLEALRRAERWRIKNGKFGSDESAGWNGFFLVPMEGDMWLVRIADDLGFRHLSISHAQRHLLPSWTILRRMKDAFFGDEVWVAQYLTPRGVKDEPWMLHLWEPIEEKLPTPHEVLV